MKPLALRLLVACSRVEQEPFCEVEVPSNGAVLIDEENVELALELVTCCAPGAHVVSYAGLGSSRFEVAGVSKRTGQCKYTYAREVELSGFETVRCASTLPFELPDAFFEVGPDLPPSASLLGADCVQP